jgi:hypothetical protein
VHDHLNVNGHHCDEQRNQSPTRRTPHPGSQDPDSAKDFRDSADRHQFRRPWEIRRHDASIKVGGDKVVQPRAHKEDCKEDSKDAVHQASFGFAN